MPCKNGHNWYCQEQNKDKTLQDEREKCQGSYTAVDQHPETGGGKVAFWASASDRFDIDCHRLANHECRHRTDEEDQGGIIEISAGEYADKQGAEDEYPGTVILWNGDLFFEVFLHDLEAYKKTCLRARLL